MVHYMFIASFASIKKSALEGGHIDSQCNPTHVVFLFKKMDYYLYVFIVPKC